MCVLFFVTEFSERLFNCDLQRFDFERLLDKALYIVNSFFSLFQTKIYVTWSKPHFKIVNIVQLTQFSSVFIEHMMFLL